MKDIRSKSDKELKEEIVDLKEVLRSERFERASGQPKPREKRRTRKEIARIRTVLNERQQKPAKTKSA